MFYRNIRGTYLFNLHFISFKMIIIIIIYLIDTFSSPFRGIKIILENLIRFCLRVEFRACGNKLESLFGLKV